MYDKRKSDKDKKSVDVSGMYKSCFKILGTSFEVCYSNWSFCKGLISACTSTDLDYYKTKIQSFFTKCVSPIKKQKRPWSSKGFK